MKNLIFIAGLTIVALLTSCKKEGCTDSNALNYDKKAKKDNKSCKYADAPIVNEIGKMTISLDHFWGDESLNFQLETEYVHPTTNDSLKFTTFKYFISNIKLKNENGTWWSQSESYFLVDLTDLSTTKLVITDIPVGEYTDISYVMGVDSTRNVSGAQTGALSTTSGMFWSWNSGYIMLKAEGLSPQSSMGGAFTYHLGGFSGSNNVVTLKTASFGSEKLNVTKTSNGMIHLGIDPTKLFTTLGSVSNVGAIHMPGANAKTMASDFYGSGVSFKMLHN